jgi:hypothetical protein
MSMILNKLSRLSAAQRLALCTGLFVMAMVASMWSAPSTSAYSELPDRTFMFPSTTAGGHSGDDVYMVVANQGTGVLLDAPTSIVTFYFDTPNAVITIGNGAGNCSEDRPQAGQNTFYGVVDPNDSNPSTSLKAFTSSPSLSCGTNNISVTGLTPHTIPGTTSVRYVATLQATLAGTGNVNAFRLSTNDGVISYSRNSGNRFALEDRDWQSTGPTSHTTRFDLPFAPSCDVTGTRQVSLSWFDDDYNTSYQGPIGMSLIEYTAGGTPTGRVETYSGPWSGEGASMNWSVSVTAGRRYIWRWTGISERNGIQFQLPFDSFYYDFNCGNRPTAHLDVTCDQIRYRINDPAGHNYNIRIVLRKNSSQPWRDAMYAENQTPSGTPGDVHTFDFGTYRDFSGWQVSYRFRSLGPNGWTQDDVTVPVRTIAACATASCAGGPTPLTSPSPGETVRVRQNITTTIGPDGDLSYALYTATPSGAGSPSFTPVVAGPPGTAGTWSASGSSIISGLGYPASPSYGGPDDYMEWDVVWPFAGEYNTTVSITGSFSLTCTSGGASAIDVTDKPYLRVWGGDVIVGCSGSAAWGTNTVDTSRGRILAFSRGNGRGSGSSLVVQAMRAIDQFSSSQRTGNTLDDYLTMANGGNGVNTTWGGSFGASQCASDYFGSAPAASGPYSGFPTASGTYSYSGNATIGGQSIANGSNITMYVNGDVTITGDITYPGSGGWTSPSQIPSLTIIARNIRIMRSAASGVSELSGTYIAQPNGATGGVIQTCAPATGSYTEAQLISNCRNQLTVYGSFVAKSVKFTRLAGSVGTANPGDSAPASTAAEKFIYGPELWLKSAGGTTNAGSYDAIVAQPPVF